MRGQPRAILWFFLLLLVTGCQSPGTRGLEGTWRKVTEADGLIDNIVQSVAVDGAGRVWFATPEGVSVLATDGSWAHYLAADGLGDNRARDVIADSAGRVWVATTGGGVSRFDGNGWVTFNTASSSLPDDFAIELAEDREANVWVLSRDGLSVIHPDDTIVYVGNPFPPGSVLGAIAVDMENHVWIGAANSGSLAEYRPETKDWQIDSVAAHVASEGEGILWDIAADQQNHLWLAADEVIEVDGPHWNVFQTRYNPLFVFIDPQGAKWIYVTAGHLLLISPDSSSSEWYDSLNGGWVGGTVNDMAYDPRGAFWFATDTGAVEFTPTR